MIYTVTFNPSLDYVVGVDNFRMRATNRTSYEQMLAGGKGINVSYVLKNLGFPSTALGFLAGYLESGEYAHAFRKGLAAGSASAFSDQLATREEMEELFQKISI